MKNYNLCAKCNCTYFNEAEYMALHTNNSAVDAAIDVWAFVDHCKNVCKLSMLTDEESMALQAVGYSRVANTNKFFIGTDDVLEFGFDLLNLYLIVKKYRLNFEGINCTEDFRQLTTDEKLAIDRFVKNRNFNGYKIGDYYEDNARSC